MNIIIVSRKHGRSRMVSSWMLAPLFVFFLAILTGIGYFGYQFLTPQELVVIDEQATNEWIQRVETQSEEVAKARIYTEEQINALRIRLAELQGRLTRLDALGERLVDVANLDEGEFDFQPATTESSVREEDAASLKEVWDGLLKNENHQLQFRL
ncbi:MAG: hypothetical protein R3309_11600, partial [Reinekea sp.]|nr:hypothetical protein [Reinekea sp.]